MNFELLHPAEQIVSIITRIYTHGMTTTSGGNLSILDENGDIWITPSGIDKGTLTVKDIIRVKRDGSIIGIHKPSVELAFHRHIYNIRPDLKAILHAHPPALVAFSLVRKIPDVKLIKSAFSVCGPIEMAVYAIPGSEMLGNIIAEVFKKGTNTVMLENHGVVIGEADMLKAFQIFETLDFCARTEIAAAVLGKLHALDFNTAAALSARNPGEYVKTEVSVEEKRSRKEICLLTKRAYDQQLFTSTQGTFSKRIAEKTFVIPAENIDRNDLLPDAFVCFENGQKEQGKSPDSSYPIHELIYAEKPDINAIVVACSPHIMAFAVTEEKFITRTIPESYLLLRDIPRFSYEEFIQNPEKVIAGLSKKTPVIMIDNECVIVTGDTLLAVFDRLEVMEYGAKAIIDSKKIGKIFVIDDEDIKDLEIAFKLPN
jgi:L-fuculose-phosphate aldolase